MQSTEKNLDLIAEFSLVKITEILIKNQELHEGLYNLSFKLEIAVGSIGPSPELKYPGIMMGISSIGLLKIEKEKTNIHTVDAAIVNPAPKKRARKKKANGGRAAGTS